VLFQKPRLLDSKIRSRSGQDSGRHVSVVREQVPIPRKSETPAHYTIKQLERSEPKFMPNYFESPEGRKFLKTYVKPPTAEEVIRDEAVEAKQEAQVPSTDVAIEQESLSLVVESIPESGDINELPSKDEPRPPRISSANPNPAERKLPKKIQAPTPTSTPNTHYRIEQQTRRKISTSSAKVALGALLIHPSHPCNFGIILANQKVVREFWVSNSGNDSTRIKVRTKGEGVSAEWGVGPIAPGMRRKVVVTVDSGIAGCGEVKGSVSVVGEKEILEIKVVGKVEK
jgi:hypothetical protein